MARTPHVPERTCIGCRGKAPRAQLLRLVVTSSGQLDVDARAIRPGRGAWIHPDPQCLTLAERRRAFGRALRTTQPLDADAVRQWLERRGPSGTPTPNRAAD
ncbi:YlxR family protein [Actinomyces slackii]|uniref:Protein of uncharacterized function (DUF448) n=1 Tax=Actinomyces slackii TaxID=52774 RepID=A0A3S4SUS1_9ACTO|nr:YlxR family protein [Actinomyces slackii]VEG75576.1 Protein of uncharacterised function (DUF448) [Actinomyces slackii]